MQNFIIKSMNASLIRCTEKNARKNHINQKATFLNINIFEYQHFERRS